MTMGYSGISLESTMRFGRARSILTARKNNTIQFSRVRSKDLGACKSRSSNGELQNS